MYMCLGNFLLPLALQCHPIGHWIRWYTSWNVGDVPGLWRTPFLKVKFLFTWWGQFRVRSPWIPSHIDVTIACGMEEMPLARSILGFSVLRAESLNIHQSCHFKPANRHIASKMSLNESTSIFPQDDNYQRPDLSLGIFFQYNRTDCNPNDHH
jgi:hypothetical protein